MHYAFFLVTVAALCIPYFSAFEWTLHKYFMHRPVETPLGTFDYAFKAHALVHHQVFKADDTYHLHREADKHTIPMAWWNGAVLIVVALLPVSLVAFLISNWWIILIAAVVGGLYYGAYEGMHWCMHLPKPQRRRLFERFWLTRVVFRWLNGHHLLHHRYMHKNFNVVLPLMDLCMWTLVVRSKLQFPQPAAGLLVPNVQPRERHRGRRSRTAWWNFDRV